MSMNREYFEGYVHGLEFAAQLTEAQASAPGITTEMADQLEEIVRAFRSMQKVLS